MFQKMLASIIFLILSLCVYNLETVNQDFFVIIFFHNVFHIVFSLELIHHVFELNEYLFHYYKALYVLLYEASVDKT